MQTRITVLNDKNELVRKVHVVVESGDGISTAAAIEDADALVKSLVNRWVHSEGVEIQVVMFKTDGDKDV